MQCEASPLRLDSPIGTSTARNALRSTSSRQDAGNCVWRYRKEVSDGVSPVMCFYLFDPPAGFQGDFGVGRFLHSVIRG